MTTPLTGSVMLANVLVGASSSTDDTVSLAFVAWISPSYRRRDGSSGDELTDDHMRLLEWRAHPTGSLAAAAQALDLAVTDVERLCADLVDAGMIERARVQCGRRCS